MKLKRTIKGKNLSRSFSVDKSKIDIDNRRVEFALSSEEPYERYFGIEILGHKKEEVDLSRLTNGAPVLAEHDSTKQIGVIEEVRIDADKVIRCIARFSKNALATEYFNDIVDGIRSKVSVGYQILEMIKVGFENQAEDCLDTYRVIKWLPYEGSIVSIPADDTVGVGRAFEEKGEEESSNEIKIYEEEQEEELTEPPAEEDSEAEKTLTNEEEVNEKEGEKKLISEKVDINVDNLENRSNINKYNNKDSKNMDMAILELGRKYGKLDLAVEFFEKGKSLNEFQGALIEEFKSGASKVDAGTKRELSKFNMNAYLDEQASRELGEQTSFAREISGNKTGERGGFILPRSVIEQHMKKDYVVGNAANGGNTAPNVFRPNMIDALYNDSVVLGSINVYPSGTGSSSVEYPIVNGKTTFQYLEENESAASSNATFDKIKFTPKYFGGKTSVSRRMLKESAFRGFDSWVTAELIRAWEEARDNYLLNDTGLNGHITGLANIAGANVIETLGVASALNYKKVVEFETLIDSQNARNGSMVYLTNSKVAGYLKTTPQMNNSIALPILQNGQMNGINVKTSNAIASNGGVARDQNTLMLINGAHVHYMEWDGYEVAVNPYKDGGQVQIELFAQFDMQVSHPQGVSICKDIVL